MKIKLLSVYCGPSGTHIVGEEIVRSDEEALALVKGGYAVPVGEPEETRTEKAVEAPTEVRVAPTTPTAKRRGR